MSKQQSKELMCDVCPPTRLVEEGSLTWGRKFSELIPFLVIGAGLLAVFAPVLFLVRTGITGQLTGLDSLAITLIYKIGLGVLGGLLLGLFAGLFGAEGGLLGGVISGVIMALAFGGTYEAPFDPAQRLDIVITSTLGGALIGLQGYFCFLIADKRVRPKTES